MTDDDLKRMFDALRQEQAETRRHFDVTADTLLQQHAETRRHFDVTAEALRKDIRAVAEGVAAVDEKLDRQVERLEEKIDRGFADTQSMIKFSHAELDRRLRTLEQAFADLQARVERLETTTH